MGRGAWILLVGLALVGAAGGLWLGSLRLAPAAPAPASTTDPALALPGRAIYARAGCFACHGAEGRPPGTAFPALVGSQLLCGDPATAIRIVLHGYDSGPPRRWAGVMPGNRQLTDGELADLLTYCRSAWGNRGSAITREQVAKERLRWPEHPVWTPDSLGAAAAQP